MAPGGRRSPLKAPLIVPVDSGAGVSAHPLLEAGVPLARAANPSEAFCGAEKIGLPRCIPKAEAGTARGDCPVTRAGRGRLRPEWDMVYGRRVDADGKGVLRDRVPRERECRVN